MTELIKNLCQLNAPSGAESSVRDFILDQIKDHAEVTVDRCGNIIAYKKGEKRASHKIMVDAHMDEVGIIATTVTPQGYVKFTTVGGIEVESLVSKRVRFLNGTVGVIGIKPVHLCEGPEQKKYPSKSSLMVDIGAKNREDAESKVLPGDTAVFDVDFEQQGDYLISKALDDRIGCAVLINLLKNSAEYDFYATFTVGEEIGLKGAKTVTNVVQPEAAIVVEATTAGDIGDVADSDKVCCVGNGAVVSFMDRSTMYDRVLFDGALTTAKEKGIACQVKQAVAGGNNAGAIHQELCGVRPLAISVPCRYIHSPSSVVKTTDIKAVYELTCAMLNRLASGEIW